MEVVSVGCSSVLAGEAPSVQRRGATPEVLQPGAAVLPMGPSRFIRDRASMSCTCRGNRGICDITGVEVMYLQQRKLCLLNVFTFYIANVQMEPKRNEFISTLLSLLKHIVVCTSIMCVYVHSLQFHLWRSAPSEQRWTHHHKTIKGAS